VAAPDTSSTARAPRAAALTPAAVTTRHLDALQIAYARRHRDLPTTSANPRTVAHRAALQRILRLIDQAKRRLADGTFGRCVSCGEPMDDLFLLEAPWRASCDSCAQPRARYGSTSAGAVKRAGHPTNGNQWRLAPSTVASR
jgi:RNA polymerase-binding transcription factor DksA